MSLEHEKLMLKMQHDGTLELLAIRSSVIRSGFSDIKYFAKKIDAHKGAMDQKIDISGCYLEWPAHTVTVAYLVIAIHERLLQDMSYETAKSIIEGCSHATHIVNINNQIHSFVYQVRPGLRDMVTDNIDSIKKQSESMCFIATAALGNGNAPEIIELRHFRDDILLQRYLGKIFVRQYYRYSPRMARFISKHQALKSATRLLLIYPLVWCIHLLQCTEGKDSK